MSDNNKRIERERSLFAATRGPDYSAHDRDVARDKRYFAKLREAAQDHAHRLALLRRHHPHDLGDEDGPGEL